MVAPEVWFPVVTSLAGVVIGGLLNGYIAERRERQTRMRLERKAIFQASLEMLLIVREFLLRAQSTARKDQTLRKDGRWLPDEFLIMRYMPSFSSLRSLGQEISQDDVFAAKNRIIAHVRTIPDAKNVDDVLAIEEAVSKEVKSIEDIVMASGNDRKMRISLTKRH